MPACITTVHGHIQEMFPAALAEFSEILLRDHPCIVSTINSLAQKIGGHYLTRH